MDYGDQKHVLFCTAEMSILGHGKNLVGLNNRSYNTLDSYPSRHTGHELMLGTVRDEMFSFVPPRPVARRPKGVSVAPD